MDVTMPAGLATNGSPPSPMLLTAGVTKRGPLIVLFSLTSELCVSEGAEVTGHGFTCTLSVFDVLITEY